MGGVEGSGDTEDACVRSSCEASTYIRTFFFSFLPQFPQTATSTFTLKNVANA